MSGLSNVPEIRKARASAPRDALASESASASSVLTDSVQIFLARAATRLSVISALHGVAIGLAAATLVALFAVPARGAVGLTLLVGALFTSIGILAVVAANATQRRRVAHLIESRAPQCRNVLITATELTSSPRSRVTPPYVANAVQREAARAVQTLDLHTLFPLRRELLAVAVSVALFAVVAARDASPVRSVARAVRVAVAPGVASINDIDITVVSPAYANREPLRFRNVARIDALQGGRIELRVRADAESLLVQTLRGAQRIAAVSANTFVVSVAADADGFVSLAPRSADGREGARRLIGISVTNDQPPRVRIVAPGRDLFLRSPSQTIALALESDDDLGLASLRLRYTMVSGSGERFTFAEGEVPLTLSRTTARSWTARASWRLDSLALTPGDMVVYRGIATDRRPGAPAQESDSFIAEFVSPGGDAAAGFAIDPDQERYAVSQQMVILKTERLIARRASMPADSVSLAALELAAEQRKVRAEFVFMMGGELADAPDPDASMTELNEEAEAEGEADILAGRLANQGRAALMRAVRSMSRAATALNTAQLTDALSAERSALAQLELAFSRTRIILRALNQRESLDLTRRLSGVLTDARSARRTIVPPTANARASTLRRILASIAAIGGAAAAPAEASATIAQVAQDVLRVDASSEALQRVSALLSEAAQTATSATGDNARWTFTRTQLDRAANALAASLRDALAPANTVAPSLDSRRLRNAMSDVPPSPRPTPP